MKPHEIIEIVLLSVAKHYGVDWREIIQQGMISKQGKPTPRAIAINYLNIYIGKDLTKDVMNCKRYDMHRAGQYCRQMQMSLLKLNREIYLRTKEAA